MLISGQIRFNLLRRKLILRDRTRHQVSYPRSRSKPNVVTGVRKLSKEHQCAKLDLDQLTYRDGIYVGNIKPLPSGLSYHPKSGTIKKKSPDAKTFSAKAIEYSGENDFSKRRLMHLNASSIPITRSWQAPDAKVFKSKVRLSESESRILNRMLRPRVNPNKLSNDEANLHFRLHQGHRSSFKPQVTIKVMKSKVKFNKSSDVIRKYPSSDVNDY